MPWSIKKRDGKHCVVKDSETESLKCYDDRSDAVDYMQALYASEGKSMTTAQIIFDTDVDNTTVIDVTRESTSSVTYPPESIKAVTLGGRYFEDLIMDVHKEWTEKYGYSGWVVRVGEKGFIAQKDRSFWEVPYTRDGEDVEISPVAEWTEMRQRNDFVAKHADYLTAIKAIDDETIGAYGILWGDGDNKDLHGEYFTKSTAELTSVLDGMGAIPFLFNHGADGVLKSTVIGKVTEMDADDIGLWFEAKITQHEAYKKLVRPLLQKKALYPSSGVLPAAKKVNKSGQITRWPIIEMTGTHMPAEHRMLNIPISEVNKFYKSVGLPELDVQTDTDDTGSEKERLEFKLRQQEQETQMMEFELEI